MEKIIYDSCRRVLRNEGISEPLMSNILMDMPVNILNAIEAAGMIPPKDETDKYGYSGETYNKWEKE